MTINKTGMFKKKVFIFCVKMVAAVFVCVTYQKTIIFQYKTWFSFISNSVTCIDSNISSVWRITGIW